MRQILSSLLASFPTFLLSQTASFTGTPLQGCSPLVVNFDASGSTGQGPLTYQWDFGNGNVSVDPGQLSPGAVYLQPGDYTVTLIVVYGAGNGPAPVSQVITAFAPPAVDFDAVPVTGCLDLYVSFSDLSIPSSAPIVNWIWDFGDGNSSQGPAPIHQYSSGTFPVSLLAIDANGCQAIETKPAFVTVMPEVEVVAQATGPRRICDSVLTVPFSATATSPGPHQFVWDFGDGTTGTGATPLHAYQGYGVYDVTVIATDLGTGCTDTMMLEDYVQLLENLADFSINPLSGCVPFTVTLTNQSAILLSDIQAIWDFGDGTQLQGASSSPALQTVTLFR